MLPHPTEEEKTSESPQKIPKKDDLPKASPAKTNKPPSDELDEVDEASRDSFPASDPPSWWR